MPAAQLLGGAPVLGCRAVDALALDRLDDERGHVVPAQLPLQGVEVAERDRRGLEQRAESLAELPAAVERQGSRRQAVEGVLGVQDPRAPGRVPRELDGSLDGLRAGVAEEDPADARVGTGDELLGQQAGEQRAVHLDHVGQVQVECLVQGRLDRRVAAAEGINPESGQKIEVLLPGVVVKVTALAADVVTVEPESPDRPGELGVHVPLVQGEVLPGPLRERAGNIEGHASPRAGSLSIDCHQVCHQ